MKYLSKLFAFDDRQSHQQSSAATLTSNLYSVTFIQESIDNSQPPQPNHHHPNPKTKREKEEEQQHLSSSSVAVASAKIAFNRNHLISSTSSSGSIISCDSIRDPSKPVLLAGDRQRKRERVKSEAIEEAASRRGGGGGAKVREEEVEEQAGSGIIGYLLAATIGKALAREYNPTIRPTEDQKHIDDDRLTKDRTSQKGDKLSVETDEDDDWILLNSDNNLSLDHHPYNNHHSKRANNTIPTAHTITTTTAATKTNTFANNINIKKSLKQLKQQMALDKADIDLIKASWVPVRKDPQASGVLLFKGLFIKFPQYLKFFPQFADLDLERMHTNSGLLSHATRVINTVTFVVDAIGDESKTSQLNDELVKLVKRHLRRKIGTPEFRNLGIVLIDFICDVFGRGGPTAAATAGSATHNVDLGQLSKSGVGNVLINTFPIPNSDTMTSALDKLRASSSPSSSSEEESYLGGGLSSEASSQAANNNLNDAKLEENNYDDDGAVNKTQREARQLLGSCNSESCSTATTGTSSSAVSSSTSSSQSSHTNSINKEAKINTNLHLVTAWTKLYNIILDLVKREETAAAPANVGE